MSRGRRKNAYDEQEEFWVTVRESGKRKQSQSYEETHKKLKQASHQQPRIHPMCTH